MEPRRYMLL